jgi:hypothetical protein
MPPLCAKPAQRPPLADVRLVHAQRGETYEPSDVRFLDRKWERREREKEKRVDGEAKCPTTSSLASTSTSTFTDLSEYKK